MDLIKIETNRCHVSGLTFDVFGCIRYLCVLCYALSVVNDYRIMAVAPITMQLIGSHQITAVRSDNVTVRTSQRLSPSRRFARPFAHRAFMALRIIICIRSGSAPNPISFFAFQVFSTHFVRIGS